MRKKLLGLVFAVALLIGTAVPLVGVGDTVFADRPDEAGHSQHGCPNDNASNGASKANENNSNSAHDPDRRAARSCE